MKEALNLLALIAELYNAGVIGSVLVYDLIRGFLADSAAGIGEKAIESLLKVLRRTPDRKKVGLTPVCGQQLRRDDPSSLKDIVGLVQDRVTGNQGSMTFVSTFSQADSG